MWSMALGIGVIFLPGLFGILIVCSRMNDPASHGEEDVVPVPGDVSPAGVPTR